VTPSSALLDVAGLSIRFGGLAALSDVDLAVGAGEIFALIGPNGAGKTTVFNIVTGLYRPLAGHVRFDGHDLLARAPHAVARLGVARTFQNTEVFRGLSALDNVLIGAHPRLRGSVIAAALGLPSVRQEEARARARAHSLLARVGLGEAPGRRPGAPGPGGGGPGPGTPTRRHSSAAKSTHRAVCSIPISSALWITIYGSASRSAIP